MTLLLPNKTGYYPTFWGLQTHPMTMLLLLGIKIYIFPKTFTQSTFQHPEAGKNTRAEIARCQPEHQNFDSRIQAFPTKWYFLSLVQG